jgi:hypothetical protein
MEQSLLLLVAVAVVVAPDIIRVDKELILEDQQET